MRSPKTPPRRKVPSPAPKLDERGRVELVNRLMARRGRLHYAHLQEIPPAVLRRQVAALEADLRDAGGDPAWPWWQLREWIEEGS